MQSPEWKAAAEKLLLKCHENGIDPLLFAREKLLELEERKRILLTPKKQWFFNNYSAYNEYAARVLKRELADGEKHGPERFAELIRRRFRPESREAFDQVTRRRMLEDTGGRCAACGTILTLQTVHIDHVIPLAEGGSNHPLNLQPLCKVCNEGKRDYFEATAHAAARPWWEPRKALVEGTVRLTPTKRWCVLARDSNTCRHCARTAREVVLFVEQRVSQQEGGQAVYDNLVTLCEGYQKRQTGDI